MPQRLSPSCTRHVGLEHLRYIAAFFVVINHAWALMPKSDSPFHLFCTCTVYSVVNVAVPLFVMLSGAFLIKNERNANAWRFWWHSFKKLFPLSFAFFLLAFFWQSPLWEGYMAGEYSFPQLLQLTLRWYAHGAALPLWYLCMLPGLYLALPFIVRLRQSCSFKSFVVVSCILFAGGIASELYSLRLPHPFSALSWLGYFTLGAVLLSLSDKKRLPAIKVLIIAACITVTCCIAYLYCSLYHEANIYQRLGRLIMPFVYILSILLFGLFAQLRPKPRAWVLTLSQLSFLIYLTHVPCQRVIRAILFHTGHIEQLHATVLNNVLFAACSLIFSTIAAYIIHRVYGKLVIFTHGVSVKLFKPHQD